MTAPVATPPTPGTVPLGTVPSAGRARFQEGTVPVRGQSPGSVEPALRKAAQAFEAVFLRQIMADMRKAKLADDLFGSASTENFREMADANSAEELARRGVFGIAALVERQFAGKTSKL